MGHAYQELEPANCATTAPDLHNPLQVDTAHSGGAAHLRHVGEGAPGVRLRVVAAQQFRCRGDAAHPVSQRHIHPRLHLAAQLHGTL